MLEILAPAGNAECADAAINNGANAIYLGLSSFSARQSAGNFDVAAFRTVVLKAHLCGVKVYVAMNTIIKDGELGEFFEALLSAWNEGADALILQDPFLGKIIHETYPEIVLHLSTQAGVCTVDGARFARSCGFSRVILARETPLAEIEKIASFIETEVFIQGALCTCFSGQCYFSSFAGGNSGNRGRCKQPCRKLYAYDRNGNTEKNYALSLSDLCVGEEIEKLIRAGVQSFKIEGRMRRAEYVAAAVRYYRVLLDGKGDGTREFSDLKRTFNRGNYTRGLAFGQDKRFLSPAVQGHIGEKVGVVKVLNGKYCVDSRFKMQIGDAFKILRDGKEIGGATYLRTEGKGFIVSSKLRLHNGDSVFVTTDTEVATRVLQAQKEGEISVSLYFHEGDSPVAECGNVRFVGINPLQKAKSRPLTEDELKNCFLKTDGLPVAVTFKEIDLKGDIFIPKSELNALRRAFYSAATEEVARNGRVAIEERTSEFSEIQGENDKTAVIASDFEGVSADIGIYKPDDFRKPLPASFKSGNFEKYIYYPAFTTAQDIERLDLWCKETEIRGVYTENYGGITFSEERGLQFFAGTGFNLSNHLSVSELLKSNNIVYYTVSKELTAEEGKRLMGDKSFALASGGIKIMDLCYCPFEKTCNKCDKKRMYNLTDENGRIFPVRRYVTADGSCRFEVYNCAELIGIGMKGVGQLLDLTLINDKETAISARDNESLQKIIYDNYTSGHYKRGVL